MTPPFETWPSPITAEAVARGTVRLDQICLDGDTLYWVEGRPTEGGRLVLVRAPGVDVTPAGFNVRNRVHEYGGGACAVDDGIVYFCNDGDQRIYRQEGETARPLTASPASPASRYADLCVDGGRLVAVREDHLEAGVVNRIVEIVLESGEETVIAEGLDFYSSPRVSADGSRLAWLSWNHPRMPWNGTDLWVAGPLGEAPAHVAGGDEESIFQPEWAEDGSLLFVSDRSGWWNLYRWRDGETVALCPMEAEFGRPQWVFGMSAYAMVDAESVVCSYVQQGVWHLGLLRDGQLRRFDLPFTDYSSVRCSREHAYFIASSPRHFSSVVKLRLADGAFEIVRSAASLELDPAMISLPHRVSFPTEGGREAHGFLYLPTNAGRSSPLPPLIVKCHGGPTGATTTGLSLETQFWTSRGFAMLDVNYGGSTGYGREYRDRLRGQSGVMEVDDCVNGARHLAADGIVDRRRMAIRGGSAGGYVVLCAIAFHDVFGSAASHYGISDVEALALDTHKFESRYLDWLVGPYPEMRDLYRARSPIHEVDRISTPLILFQGLEDRVVPPDQSQKIFEALAKKGVPVAYVAYPGEQHGFRKAENIRRTLEAELYFHARVFGFTLGETLEPVPIVNLGP
jgi:dipeptidyl aminopeptidase/acylaminoacyl peptidase